MLRTAIRSLSLLLVLAVTPVLAAKYPPAVQTAVDRGVKILNTFHAPGGLTGYIGRSHGHIFVFYATADGDHLLVGRIFDVKGHDVTRDERTRYGPKPDLKTAWSRLEKAAWVPEGARSPKTIIYEFTDPNCPFCHLFWLANQPYLKEGLQVRHLLVGIVTSTSRAKAAAILQSKDPSAAYTENERHYRTDVPESQAGAVAPAKHPSVEVLAKIDANEKLMGALQLDGTPGIVFKDATGKVRTLAGLPRLSMLAKMYGLPAQPITDPRLRRFK